jgi:hypothetical protein
MAKLSNTATANQAAFGQLGSAFIDDLDHTIHAPEGMVIVAITFLADAVLDSLIAEDPERTINTAQAAHSKGFFQANVNGAVTAAADIVVDEAVVATLGLQLGDEVYDEDGLLLGTVITLETGSDANTFTISANCTLANDEVISFLRPGVSSGGRGVGGMQIETTGSDNSFPRGLTIYGRWLSVSLQANSPQGGLIAYFG